MPGSRVDIPTPDGVANAYLARPDQDPRPGVLFIMDAYGLRPAIEQMVDRIAADGYIVLAPNMFYRAGRSPVGPLPDLSDPDARASFFQSLRPLFAQLSPETVASDAAAYLEFLAAAGAPGPVAITGYCMGARIGWKIATEYPDRVAALAGFHGGGLATDAPDSPHRSAGELKAECYFGFADQDQSMTAEQIATFERALEEAGVGYRSEVYEGAPHGYTMSDTPAYREEARERHFRELKALLERTVGASPRAAV
jgi:carboxymethylenebutenolidase